MEPADDPKLSSLLREWQAPNAPQSLDARVLGPRRKWWSFLLTGSIRVPIPVGLAFAAILVVMAAALLRQTTPAPAPSPVSLIDFRPPDDLNVRVIRGSYEPR
jgi:hypothetical protein